MLIDRNGHATRDRKKLKQMHGFKIASCGRANSGKFSEVNSSQRLIFSYAVIHTRRSHERVLAHKNFSRPGFSSGKTIQSCRMISRGEVAILIHASHPGVDERLSQTRNKMPGCLILACAIVTPPVLPSLTSVRAAAAERPCRSLR